MPTTRHRDPRGLWLAGAALAVLTACSGGGGGGGSASVSGPSAGGSGTSTATVQGQILSTQATGAAEPTVFVVLRAVLGVGLAEAQAGTPVAGAQVDLVSGGVVIQTTTTDASGNFLFQNVPPGTYTIQVTVGGVVQTIALPAPGIVVGAGDQATIVGRVTTTATTGTVAVVATDVSDVTQNDAQLGHAINIDNASTTCDLVDVIERRERGLGWGLIAQQCGAPPSVIGLGHSNVSGDDLEDARQRSGRGRGRGQGNGRGRG